MVSESSSRKLPVIDFSVPDLKPGSLEWDSLKSEVRKAAEEYGFFEALFDKVEDLKQETVSALEELFELPLQTKQRNVSSGKSFNGYRSASPVNPLVESMGIDDALTSSTKSIVLPPSYGHKETQLLVGRVIIAAASLINLVILWFLIQYFSSSKTLQSCSEQLLELDQIVRRMIVECLDLEKYMDEHMNSTNYHLRLMKYKGPETTGGQVGLRTHNDKHTLSILFQNQVSGLELQAKDGEWITAELTTPHSFIVIIGDSLHTWTNGRTRSLLHRVVMSGYEARYSIGLFSVPKRSYIIKTPEEVIDEEYSLLYKPRELSEFLGYYLTETGQKDPFPLRTFCGV